MQAKRQIENLNATTAQNALSERRKNCGTKEATPTSENINVDSAICAFSELTIEKDTKTRTHPSKSTNASHATSPSAEKTSTIATVCAKSVNATKRTSKLNKTPNDTETL